ncbi:hypothetical protein ACIGDI_11375 [Streptomyces sp. NPDC085900]|uniref:hypothetical protein n=1 Tax=Streptomyces sp. NPDC085900 TaxID=3365737 RepID=UPI0037CD89EC
MATAKWYGPALQKLMTKQMDLISDTIKVALVKSTYTPNQNTHDEWADVSANEVTGTGYAAGGIALASKTITYNTTNKYWTFDAADSTWTNTNVLFRYAVIYDDTATGKPLLGYVDFGTAQTVSNQDLTIQWEIFEQDPESGTFYSDSGILRVSL